LGTALLNTLFAGAVTSYFAANLTNPADVQKLTPLAFIHGYHVAFFWASMLLLAGLAVAVFVINARREDVPADAAPVAA